MEKGERWDKTSCKESETTENNKSRIDVVSFCDRITLSIYNYVRRNQMGKQLIWQDRFNIGVSFIDEEHKKLFSILNKLFEHGKQEEKGRWVCQEGIKYFKEHAMKHFTEEENYMASIQYAGFETHRRLHDNFRKRCSHPLKGNWCGQIIPKMPLTIFWAFVPVGWSDIL